MHAARPIQAAIVKADHMQSLAVDLESQGFVAQNTDALILQRQCNAIGSGIVIVVAKNRDDSQTSPQPGERWEEPLEVGLGPVGNVTGDTDQIRALQVDALDEVVQLRERQVLTDMNVTELKDTPLTGPPRQRNGEPIEMKLPLSARVAEDHGRR